MAILQDENRHRSKSATPIQAGLPKGHEVLAWCATMLKTDRVGFIAHEAIEALQSHWKRIAAS